MLLRTALAAAFVAVCFAPVALADLSHPLLSMSNAVVSGSVDVVGQSQALHGSANAAGEAGESQFNITVDYAVFAPGMYTGDFTVFSRFGAPGAGDYIYAYQIHSNANVAAGSSSSLSRMGVDLAGGQVSSMGYSNDPASGLIAPSDGRAYSDSFMFLFAPSQRVGPGQSSAILLLTSPDGWDFAPMGLLNGGRFGGARTPTPAANPVPSAALLVMIGLGMVSSVKSRFGSRFARV